MNVPVVVRCENARGDASGLQRKLVGCLRKLKAGRRELSVLLTDDARLRALNRSFRKIDRSTDVLSFEQEGDSLGDVAVSIPAAQRASRKSKISVKDEVLTLCVHGLLHLRGHDHATARQTARMSAAEERLLRPHGLRSGLARAAEEGGGA